MLWAKILVDFNLVVSTRTTKPPNSIPRQIFWLYDIPVCMCVCMCVCMYVYLYVCMYVCMCVCMYVCLYVCMYVCVCVCMYVCMCVCVCVCVYVCMYVCIYVCVYVKESMSKFRCLLCPCRLPHCVSCSWRVPPPFPLVSEVV